MTSYICPRCNYTTKRKSNFKHHITRKNLCNPINSDISIKSIAKSYGIDISSTEINNCTNSNIISNISKAQKPTQSRAHKHTQILTQNTIKCKYCNKQFNSTNSCYRHQKHYCKHKKEVTKEQIENKVKEVVEQKMREAEKKMREAEQKLIDAEQKIKEVQKENDAKVEVLADKKAQELVLSIVDKLLPNQTTNTNCHNTNSHNNTQNNTLINNNNNNHLKINNFGEEKTKSITDDKLKIMFVDPRNVVVQHIKDTYYHVLHPENFNAKITNCKSKHMHIYKDNDWEKVNKQLTICSMYNKHEKIIESEFERLKPELTDTVRDNYNEYKKSTLHSFSTFKHRMVDIEAAIINGTKRHEKIDLLSEKEVARLAKEQGKTPGEIFAEHMPDIFAERDGLTDE